MPDHLQQPQDPFGDGSLLLQAAGQAAARFSLGLRTRDDYADAIQEIVVRTIRSFRPSPVQDHLRAYVFTIARHLQADRIRASAARTSPAHVEQAADLVRQAMDEGDDRDVDPHLSTVLLRLIKNRLPSLHHHILNERICRGRTFVEIARGVDVPPATAQRRFREALEILRLELMREAIHDLALKETLVRLGYPGDGAEE